MKKHTIKVRSSAKTTPSGNIRVSTSVSNGHVTRTRSKTIRVK